MIRRGEVDLSGVVNVDCQFRDFDIENGCEVIVSYKRDIIDYFKKDFDEEDLSSVEALITIYDFYVEWTTSIWNYKIYEKMNSAIL